MCAYTQCCGVGIGAKVPVVLIFAETAPPPTLSLAFHLARQLGVTVDQLFHSPL